MDWIVNNLAETLLVVGLLLLVVEIVVLGFSTFVLFFVGCAAVLTSALLYLTWLPNTLVAACLSTAIITAILAIFFWKPLKNMQSKVDDKSAKGDLVGHQFILTEEVSPSSQPIYRYSGIDWKLQSDQTIAAGSKVEVIQAEVGVFHLKAL
ncbi:NfeD family protein [Paraglaciecola aestuariivivens]